MTINLTELRFRPMFIAGENIATLSWWARESGVKFSKLHLAPSETLHELSSLLGRTITTEDFLPHVYDDGAMKREILRAI